MDESPQMVQLQAQLALLQQQQQAFAFGISHDLRAPLRMIDAHARQLQQRLGTDADAQLQEPLQRIRDAVAHSGHLIDGLLEYSRVARIELHPQPVDLAFLAEWAWMELQNADVNMVPPPRIQPGLWVSGDERLLQLLLVKVLDNARKFAHPERELALQIRGRSEGGMLHATVADNGIGMQLRDAAQPFEPFQRLHSASQGSGDGLGLAIARTIVERHGGQIRLESEPGQGSTVHFSLPLADAALSAAHQGRAAGPP